MFNASSDTTVHLGEPYSVNATQSATDIFSSPATRATPIVSYYYNTASSLTATGTVTPAARTGAAAGNKAGGIWGMGMGIMAGSGGMLALW